ncbi:MAG: hypothetical protein ISR58_06140 [Anaerolineales bacterium]|nr:hypothetical protein [Chloroflexota bacterium]MBL6980756.1 hypothetical protein [Anaerolineales bacterium]
MKLPGPNSLVLVAFLPSPCDLEMARVLGWYRIPLATSPKVIAVDYLAFYQPASFRERKWCIEYVAPVLGHELTTRGELLRNQPDHARAEEQYFKIQLGTLTPLPNPVVARKWKRITFLYTTGEYLLGAETVNDLVVHSEERKLLWRALRERVGHHQRYDVPDVDVPPEVLALLLGIKELSGEYD